MPALAQTDKSLLLDTAGQTQFSGTFAEPQACHGLALGVVIAHAQMLAKIRRRVPEIHLVLGLSMAQKADVAAGKLGKRISVFFCEDTLLLTLRVTGRTVRKYDTGRGAFFGASTGAACTNVAAIAPPWPGPADVAARFATAGVARRDSDGDSQPWKHRDSRARSEAKAVLSPSPRRFVRGRPPTATAQAEDESRQR